MTENDKAARAQELRNQIARSRRVEGFLKSELWADIYALLAERQDKLKSEALWTPTTAQFDPNEIAMRVAFASGRDYEIGEILKMFQRWNTQGQEAEVKLKEMGVES